MSRRIDRGLIGSDKRGYSHPDYVFYDCQGDFCTQIFDMQCNRKCNGTIFNLESPSNVLIFTHENVLIANCQQNSVIPNRNIGTKTKIMAISCSQIIEDSSDNGKIIGSDCIDGKWMMKKSGNYDYFTLKNEYFNIKKLDFITQVPAYENLVIQNNSR
jgi:hypothetical protein